MGLHALSVSVARFFWNGATGESTYNPPDQFIPSRRPGHANGEVKRDLMHTLLAEAMPNSGSMGPNTVTKQPGWTPGGQMDDMRGPREQSALFPEREKKP